MINLLKTIFGTSMASKCEFCQNEFSTLFNLKLHQKSAKYCLALRGVSVVKSFRCDQCDKNFSRQSTLTNHKKQCLLRSKRWEKVAEDLKIENETLKEEIADLKLQLARKDGMLSVKAGPKTVNHNYTNQKLLNISCATIDPLTVSTIKKAVDAGKYTFQHFKLGPSGIVDFISDIICTDDGQKNYACSDISRNKCHRLIETREWETDNGATFINSILDELREPATKYNQKILDMWHREEDREDGDFLREKTRSMVAGISDPSSSNRRELFTKIRTDVKNLASI